MDVFVFVILTGIMTSVIDARSAEIEHTLEAYVSHDSRLSPPNREVKVFILPESDVPWKIKWWSIYETTRNGGEFTSYEVRILPSRENVQRVELEVTACLNRHTHCEFAFLSFGSGTWVGVKADFSFMPATQESADPYEYLNSVTEYYFINEPNLRASQDNTIDELMEEANDSNEFIGRATSELAQIVGTYKNSVETVRQAVEGLKAAIQNDVHLIGDANRFQSSIQNSTDIYFRKLNETVDLLGIDREEVFNGHPNSSATSVFSVVEYHSPVILDVEKEFIRKCYRDSLNREPEPEGCAYWMNVCHDHGLSFTQRQIEASNEAFVHRCYRDSLGRWAEPGGLNYWMGRVQADGRGAVSREIHHSEEAWNRRDRS